MGARGAHVPTLILLSYWRPKPNADSQELGHPSRSQSQSQKLPFRQLKTLEWPGKLLAHPGVALSPPPAGTQPPLSPFRSQASANQAKCPKGCENSFAKKVASRISAHMLQAIFVIIIYRCCHLRPARPAPVPGPGSFYFWPKRPSIDITERRFLRIYVQMKAALLGQLPRGFRSLHTLKISWLQIYEHYIFFYMNQGPQENRLWKPNFTTLILEFLSTF